MERFKTLKDHVYEYIEEQIMKGTLLPGERINENTICEELGISRTPVREAGVQHLLHLKSKSKILRPIEIMGFFYEFFCQI